MLNGPMKAGVTACVIAVLAAPALAQSSLGIGSNEVAPVATSGLFGWIYAEQQQFFRALQAALSRMRDDGTGAMALIGLSFAYGVFHAAGPGHGKAVISSWLIANDAQLKRGIALSFASSAMQAVSAILLVGAAFLVLRAISISMTDAAWVLEMASYGLIMGFGAVLLWRKVAGGGHSHGDSLQHQHDGHDHRHAHHHDDHDHIGQGHHHHHHVDGEACAACGHAHAPSPAAVSSQTFSLAEAWGIIAAVGMRPCSGAIVVLSFALLNGLYVAGLASVFVMALGTAITVSALAILAVHAKGLAQRLAGAHAATTGHAIEILGALAVFALGAGMLYAGLTA
ncbi:MAG: nickel/cobalt transporter [Rhizobiaceae bacterium]|nr:nickel/cobalt transporter [Rhizobiaceae bacterium]